ncbi:hypothetical protein HRW18_33550 [Streptomyces lunaelactis]|uniref:hypothetical protein n=1 Tax=Streptomyces TaxID=1883 RepID=UPI001584FA9D|nr:MULTISPECIES: hypothetical protein [Streptomyces]NUK12806.1 hypothetical protein [Streptomyces lunaelactis]NUK75657.1 hypothetical protein [Streptomyces lunaelactis]NUL14913.1 hypothetical protein [Streptomyces lunaelactis]NUL27700.1 hypothetical protein [Streptomyces lunaelactis]WSP67920.1 hypothetical protein OG466_40315 [Streptomyces sp. NBC_01240]
MALSISLVLLLGIIVVILVRTGYQRIMPGIAVLLFGFFLANTGIAPTITGAVSSVTGWISSF